MDLIHESTDIVDTDLELKIKEYMDYLNQHITRVIDEFKKYFVPLVTSDELPANIGKYTKDDFIYAIKKCALTIDKHDLSKYNDMEFYPYRRHWHPTVKEESEDDDRQQVAEEQYEKAWQHHYEHNNHHVQHWYDFNNSMTKDIPLECVVEMICDWISMSIIKNNPTIDYWWKTDADKERSMMTVDTIAAINDIYTLLTK